MVEAKHPVKGTTEGEEGSNLRCMCPCRHRQRRLGELTASQRPWIHGWPDCGMSFQISAVLVHGISPRRQAGGWKRASKMAQYGLRRSRWRLLRRGAQFPDKPSTPSRVSTQEAQKLPTSVHRRPGRPQRLRRCLPIGDVLAGSDEASMQDMDGCGPD